MAIMLGSLEAHYLRKILTENEVKSIEIGVRYQLFHSIAILILALNSQKFYPNITKSLKIMTIGIFLFSFSIYLLSIQKLINISIHFLGAITPVGGILLIISCIILFFSVKKID